MNDQVQENERQQAHQQFGVQVHFPNCLIRLRVLARASSGDASADWNQSSHRFASMSSEMAGRVKGEKTGPDAGSGARADAENRRERLRRAIEPALRATKGMPALQFERGGVSRRLTSPGQRLPRIQGQPQSASLYSPSDTLSSVIVKDSQAGPLGVAQDERLRYRLVFAGETPAQGPFEFPQDKQDRRPRSHVAGASAKENERNRRRYVPGRRAERRG